MVNGLCFNNSSIVGTRAGEDYETSDRLRIS